MPVDADNLASLVEEAEVKGEAHAEGVNAGAAGNQQAGPGLVSIEVGEAEKAGAETGRKTNFPAEDRDDL
jgi:hypothetical protein